MQEGECMDTCCDVDSWANVMLVWSLWILTEYYTCAHVCQCARTEQHSVELDIK